MIALFSLLADPDVDGRTKFSADYYPYVGMRELMDDSWYIRYRVDDESNVYVAYMKSRADVDRQSQLNA
jgi:hypothetical protein